MPLRANNAAVSAPSRPIGATTRNARSAGALAPAETVTETPPAAQPFTDATKPRTSAAGSEYASPSVDSTADMYSLAHSGKS